eukprot:TRINITY_DN24813_c0_g1_i2.p1 TRINITY_DN24813_c0_g1~~TRINITY_DN24813_c0_g1_i2.p1  ORF type:complete len:469 (+),score=89.49 TRINITY_DN24813_c0_g1_i2:164-1570(+)
MGDGISRALAGTTGEDEYANHGRFGYDTTASSAAYHGQSGPRMHGAHADMGHLAYGTESYMVPSQPRVSASHHTFHGGGDGFGGGGVSNGGGTGGVYVTSAAQYSREPFGPGIGSELPTRQSFGMAPCSTVLPPSTSVSCADSVYWAASQPASGCGGCGYGGAGFSGGCPANGSCNGYSVRQAAAEVQPYSRTGAMTFNPAPPPRPPSAPSPPKYGGYVGNSSGGCASTINGNSVNSGMQENVLLWDWDDTLMASSAINASQFPPQQAQQLEAIVEQVLQQSLRLGDTYIVTNADEQWVAQSSIRFVPRVMQLLSQIPILSARKKWEPRCPGDVFAWKRETFKEIFHSRGLSQSGGMGMNLTVLGDSPSEMEAAQTATLPLQCHPLVVKTVKFKEAPSGAELIDQLKILSQELASIVADDRGGRRDLASSIQSQAYVSTGNLPGVGGSFSGPNGTLGGSSSPQMLRVV